VLGEAFSLLAKARKEKNLGGLAALREEF